MKKFIKNKMFGRTLLISSLALVMVCGVFVYSTPAQAAISAGSIAGASAADLVVGTTDADYDFSFITNTANVAEQIIITFPAQFTITNGDLGTSAINDGSLAGRILVNGVSRAVDNMTGSGGNTITIVLGTPRDLSAGANTFTITSGIANESSAGPTGTLTIDTDASGETEESGITGVTLTTGPVSYLKITAASGTPTAGATDELTITAYDANDNVCSAGPYVYEGAKSLTFSGLSNAPDTTVPTVEGINQGSATSVTFTAGVAGGGLATLIAYDAESASLDVTDGTYNSSGDEGYDLDLVVAPGTATEIVFTTQPSGSVSGVALTGQPVVSARDDYENVDTSFVATITLSEDDSGSLSGDVDVAALAGVATFVDVTYTASVDGETFQLEADEPGALANPTSSGVVSNVVATKLVISAVSSTANDPHARFADNISLTVTAVDEDGTTDTAEASTFSVAMTDSTSDALTITNNTGTLSSGTATLTTVNITAANLTATTPDGDTLSLVASDAFSHLRM